MTSPLEEKLNEIHLKTSQLVDKLNSISQENLALKSENEQLKVLVESQNEELKSFKNRDKITKLMTPSQIEKAQDLARECVKKNYKGC